MYVERPDIIRVYSRKESPHLGVSGFLITLLVPEVRGMGSLDALPVTSQPVWLSRK